MSGRPYLYPELWHGCVGAWCPSQQRFPASTLRDYSGRNNHGTLTNFTLATSWGPSLGGPVALSCDGTDDYVSIGGNATIVATNQFSFSLWWKTSTATTGRHIMSIGSTASDTPIAILGIGNTAGIPRWFLRDDASSGVEVNGTAGTANTGQWVFVCGTRFGANMDLFLNGYRVANSTALSLGTITMNTCSLGAISRNTGVSGYHTGEIDDAMIHNRVLTEAEILLRSRRRGIAYTLAAKRNRVSVAAAPPSTTSGNLLLLGVG